MVAYLIINNWPNEETEIRREAYADRLEAREKIARLKKHDQYKNQYLELFRISVKKRKKKKW